MFSSNRLCQRDSPVSYRWEKEVSCILMCFRLFSTDRLLDEQQRCWTMAYSHRSIRSTHQSSANAVGWVRSKRKSMIIRHAFLFFWWSSSFFSTSQICKLSLFQSTRYICYSFFRFDRRFISFGFDIWSGKIVATLTSPTPTNLSTIETSLEKFITMVTNISSSSIDLTSWTKSLLILFFQMYVICMMNDPSDGFTFLIYWSTSDILVIGLTRCFVNRNQHQVDISLAD